MKKCVTQNRIEDVQYIGVPGIPGEERDERN